MLLEMEIELKDNSAYETIQEYADSHKLPSSRLRLQCSAGLSKICLISVLTTLLLCSMAIVGVTVVILIHLKTQPVCDNSTPTTSSTMTTSTITAGGLIGENSILNQTFDTVNELYDFIEMQSTSGKNDTRNIIDILKTTRDSAQKLTKIFSILSKLEASSASTTGVVNDTLIAVINFLELQNGSDSTSCQHILDLHPGSVNHHYIYCNMGELCGSGGGWTRLAYLDMNDATQNCPPGFLLYQSGGVRACGRPESGPSTASIKFPSNGISYSQVCGQVVGYQYGSPDALHVYSHLSHHNYLNSYYVDGVSITRGSPRQHVWTLIAGNYDTCSSYAHNCPCSPGSTQQVQSFISSYYFCESGNFNDHWSHILYTSDPLWDGQGCGTQDTACCSAPGLPWFHRNYGNATTTDYLELRVCADESPSNEDVPVSYYEIYVK